MSQSIRHVRHAELLKTGFSDIESAKLAIENNRAGVVVNFWEDSSGVGFTYLSSELSWFSVFLVYNGAVYECRLQLLNPYD